jgi:hypothetical protein
MRTAQKTIPIAFCLIACACSPLHQLEKAKVDPSTMPKEWIVRTTSIEQETFMIQRIPESKKSEWQRFTNSITPKDQLCYWQFDNKFDEKCYLGYCLTRGGKVVAFVHVATWQSYVH